MKLSLFQRISETRTKDGLRAKLLTKLHVMTRQSNGRTLPCTAVRVLRHGRFGVRFPVGEGKMFFFSETSRPALETTQPPIQQLPQFLPGVLSLHLLRMRGTPPPPSCIPPWCGHEKIHPFYPQHIPFPILEWSYATISKFVGYKGPLKLSLNLG